MPEYAHAPCLIKLSQMILPCISIYGEVINKPLLLRCEDGVHVRSKGGKYVGQPQWHDEELVVPKMKLRCSLVISHSKINLQVIHLSMKLIHPLIDHR
jgi:hypothetical protein